VKNEFNFIEVINRVKSALKIKADYELATRLGMKATSFNSRKKANSLPYEELLLLASSENINMNWLLTGNGDMEKSDSNEKSEKIESNAVFMGGFEIWDGGTPITLDEVALPFFREVELSAGSGSWQVQVQENHGYKLRFAKSTLRKQGIQEQNAYCVTVKGTSMEPVLPDGSVVGIDTASTSIIDGKAYAIDQSGELRVKLLYRIAGGGIRLRSYNSEEYPDEIYDQGKEKNIRILGKVFWHSVLW
jgi:phage repressor protein C with HTH and peptisase S24 domain